MDTPEFMHVITPMYGTVIKRNGGHVADGSAEGSHDPEGVRPTYDGPSTVSNGAIID